MLADVFVYHKPPARRLPPLVLTRLLADVAEYVVEGGGGLLAWYHRAFREASQRRYLSDRASRVRAYAALADYWCGRWVGEAKPPLRLAKISEVLEAVSCGAPAQPARFGSSCAADAGRLDGPPNLRMLSEKVPTLLALLALLHEDVGVAPPPSRLYYRAMLEDALSDPAFIDACLEHDVNDSVKLRLLIWAREFEGMAEAEARAGPGRESPLSLVFCRLKERALERALGLEDGLIARGLILAADFLQYAAQYALSLPLYERALSIREKALGPSHPDAGAVLNSLARLYKAMGRYADAVPLFTRSLSVRENALGEEHVDTTTSLNDLASLYWAMGKYADALPLQQRALLSRERALGPEHPDTAASLNRLAILLRAMGRHADALPLYQRALAIREKAMGPEHPQTGTSLNNLASLYQDVGRYADALPLYQRALSICEKALGPEHPGTGDPLIGLARLYYATGCYGDALSFYRRLLPIWEKSLGPEHPFTSTALHNMAVLYQAMGRYDDALPLLRRALSICEKAMGPEKHQTGIALSNLANLYRYNGAPGGADGCPAADESLLIAAARF